MTKITIINIDTMQPLTETTTKKTKNFQQIAIDLIKKDIIQNFFIQGSITFESNQPPALSLGSNMWWISRVGRLQYKIEVL